MRWKTDNIEGLLGDREWQIERQRQGGDVDTTRLMLTAHSSHPEDVLDPIHLWVYGFHTQECIDTPDDTDIEMVVVTDGLDSRGGLNTGDLATCVMYGIVCSRLRQAGFTVVPSLDGYF